MGHKTTDVLATVFLGLIVTILVPATAAGALWFYNFNGRLIRLEETVQSAHKMHDLVHDLESRTAELEK